MNKRNNISIILLVLLGIAGIVFSYILAQEFYYGDIFKKAGDKLSLFSEFSGQVCGEGSSFINCTAVSKSKYSTIFSIPLALWGLFFFFIITFLSGSLIFIKEKMNSSLTVLFFWLVVVGSVFDMVLFFISILSIKALCPLCLVTYIILWIILAIMIFNLVVSKRNPLSIISVFRDILSTHERRGVIIYSALIVVVILLSGGIGFATNKYLIHNKKEYGKEKQEEEASFILEKFMEQKEIEIDISHPLVIGNPDALLEIVKFSDFMCPACARTAHTLDKVISNYPDKVKLIFVNYPLDISCNTGMRRQLHGGACVLAKIGICAAEQGKFKEYYEKAFDTVKRRKKGKVGISIPQGLDMKKFKKCVKSSGTREILQSHLTEAKKLGVRSTPTMFINNKIFKFRRSENILNRVIQSELEQLYKKDK
ncbi:thioredoxin domain-containing protein [Spirochaetota bacterium]